MGRKDEFSEQLIDLIMAMFERTPVLSVGKIAEAYRKEYGVKIGVPDLSDLIQKKLPRLRTTLQAEGYQCVIPNSQFFRRFSAKKLPTEKNDALRALHHGAKHPYGGLVWCSPEYPDTALLIQADTERAYHNSTPKVRNVTDRLIDAMNSGIIPRDVGENILLNGQGQTRPTKEIVRGAGEIESGEKR